MKWYSDTRSNGIVLSTRVRLARNVKGYPFGKKISQEQRADLIKEVRYAFEKFGTDRYNYMDMSSKSQIEKSLLVEEHIISPEFASLAPSESSMLVYDENNSVSVMIGEEDHIRIQSIKAGFALKEAYDIADAIDNMLSQGLEFSYDDSLGYLTCCPSNTGTGLRISCMVHLPMLTRNDYMKSVIEYCTRSGLTVRGFFGEGSRADGEIYQISNQITLGISEEETAKRIEEVITTIVNKEASLRTQLKSASESVKDKLWRSYGILSKARCIDSKEFLSLLSDCILGKECGILTDLNDNNLVRMLIECMPAHLINADPKCKDPSHRDIFRAERIRNMLKV